MERLQGWLIEVWTTSATLSVSQRVRCSRIKVRWVVLSIYRRQPSRVPECQPSGVPHLATFRRWRWAVREQAAVPVISL